MEVQVIGFVPPLVGLENQFNTFRVGGALAKRIACGDAVFLMNEKTKVVFGRAEVERIEVGPLWDLCVAYAYRNHLELTNDPVGAPERLFAYIQKLYGPHIAPPTKKSCVIFLRRLE